MRRALAAAASVLWLAGCGGSGETTPAAGTPSPPAAATPQAPAAHGTMEHGAGGPAAAAAAAGIGDLPVLPGAIGPLHHPIRTTAAGTQQLFDQGLTLYYGFNRDAARRSFDGAIARDPQAAMAYVGRALSLGPNLNVDPTPDERTAACHAARMARERAADAAEQGYADALAARNCGPDADASAEAYMAAMRALKTAFPGDVDAATLYVDSLITLRRRTPATDAEILTVLDAVLKLDATHVGANHYYVHLLEGSDTPGRALASARRLDTLVPAVGHLLHMPSHIYLRFGQYEAALASNRRAADADRAYVRDNHGDTEYRTHVLHTLDSLTVGAGFLGLLDEALAAAKGANSLPTLAFTLLRFQKWSDVLALPAPDDTPSRLWYHFARAVAHAAQGDLPAATTDAQAFDDTARQIPQGAIYRSNPAAAVLGVHRDIIAARIAAARKDTAGAIQAWERAVGGDDALAYHDPPALYYPTRESLGAALFNAGRYGEAETIFRADLKRHPRNGRSLFGLASTLDAQRRTADADTVRRQFTSVWTDAAVSLSLADY